jgi:hypothetical protein
VKGEASTSEAAALIARTARHFAHKVSVVTSDGYAAVDTRFGRAELTSAGDTIEIVLTPIDGDAVERLQDGIDSYLTRFARAPLDIRWSDREETGDA